MAGLFLLGGRGDGEVKVPFLGRRWCVRRYWKVRGEKTFLIRVLVLRWVVEGAGKDCVSHPVFWRKDVFFWKVLSGEFVSCGVSTREEIVFLFILPFSLERKRKKRGEPTNGSPLTRFQRSTGTLSPSIAPAQGDGLNVSNQAVVRTAPRGRRSTAALR